MQVLVSMTQEFPDRLQALAIAAATFAIVAILGVVLGPFVFLNALAFAAAVGVVALYFRWRAAGLLLIGLAASPLFPYLNRAGGEAFSASLLTVAAVFLTQGQPLAAALATSLVSAQSGAFSPLAAILMLHWASQKRKQRRGLTPIEISIATLCVCLLALQPLFTLWRHHTLNVKPELINLTRVAGLLIDPDIGLLFSWPVGVVLALSTIVGLLRNQDLVRKYQAYWVFAIGAAAYLSIVASMQTDYTHSIPRYALLLLPFFLIGLILVYDRERTYFASVIATVCIAGCAAGFGYAAVVTDFQSTSRRHPQAELWYRHFPAAYDPDEQAFADITLGKQHADSYQLSLTGRYPINELPDPHIWALSNKACTKLLVFAFAFTSSQVESRLPFGCAKPLDPAQLLRFAKLAGGRSTRDRYVNIPARELDRMRIPTYPQIPDRPPNRAPHADPITVSSRNGPEITYVLRVADPDGWQDIDSVFLAIGSTAESGCYFVYNQPLGALAIAKPSEQGQGSARAIPGHPGELRGEHCSVEPQNVTVEASGETLTLTLPVTLDPALAGLEALIQTGVTDFAQVKSGWTDASHVFAPPASAPPSDLTFAAKRMDQGEVVTVTLRPGNDFRTITHLWIIIHDRLDLNNACHVGLEPLARRIYLIPDDTRGKAMDARLGSAEFLGNSQCAIDVAKSTLVMNKNAIVFDLRVLRKRTFSTRKRVWAGYQDEVGKVQGWREIGEM